jgi:hypothetical protein
MLKLTYMRAAPALPSSFRRLAPQFYRIKDAVKKLTSEGGIL